MKKYLLISDFCLTARNRGTAALGYGALSFLRERGYIDEDTIIASVSFSWNPFKKNTFESLKVQGEAFKYKCFAVSVFEYQLYKRLHIRMKCLPFGKLLSGLKCVAAINGGDGFSDVYGDYLFNTRNPYSFLAMSIKVPLIFLPQTIGPFKEEYNKRIARTILKYASGVFVRDTKYVNELQKWGVKYEITKDLSAYMKPEPWDIDIQPNSVGINVSGLAYSNQFLDLAGQFSAYPKLINRLIAHFRDRGHTVYIIPHAYGYNNPEENNDDMIACREAYARLEDKTNVVLVDRDLLSPQIKYLISKMRFFCGTRMHANFAAIYTGVPVFGLSYSYKFEGAFSANGLNPSKQLAMINNIAESDIDTIINKADAFYKESVG